MPKQHSTPRRCEESQTISLRCPHCGDLFSAEGPKPFIQMIRRSWQRTHHSPHGCKVAAHLELDSL
jgi:hypothetical protein